MRTGGKRKRLLKQLNLKLKLKIKLKRTKKYKLQNNSSKKIWMIARKARNSFISQGENQKLTLTIIWRDKFKRSSRSNPRSTET